MKNIERKPRYGESALIITIPTNCPEFTHQLLKQGLITCLRQNLTATDKRESDADGLIVVADLLQALV